jgi:hypothetical protein
VALIIDYVLSFPALKLTYHWRNHLPLLKGEFLELSGNSIKPSIRIEIQTLPRQQEIFIGTMSQTGLESGRIKAAELRIKDLILGR